MNITYLLRALLRKKWIITFATLIAVAAAVAFTINNERKYESVAEIATGFTMNDPANIYTNEQSFNMYNADIKFSNAIQIMTSPQVIGLLSYSLLFHDLNNSDSAFRHLDNIKRSSSVYQTIKLQSAGPLLRQKLADLQMLSSFNPTERNVIELLKLYNYDYNSIIKHLMVYRVQGTDYINIVFQSENPLLSAYAVNQLCSEFNRFYSTYLNQRTDSSVQLLSAIVSQKKALLDQKNNMLQSALSGNNEDITTVNVDLIKQYQGQIIQEKSNLTAATLELQEVNQQISKFSSTNNISGNTNDAILALQREINEFNTEYINTGSSNQALQNKIKNLREDLVNKISQLPSSAPGRVSLADLLQKKSDLEVKKKLSEQNITSMQSSLRSLNSNVRTSSSKDALLSALQKEVDIATADYSNAKEKYNMALASTNSGTGFKQVLMGQPAVDPLPSKRWLIIAMAGLIMLLLSSGTIVFLEYLDLSIKTPSNFVGTSGLKLISLINYANLKKNKIIEIISEEAMPNQRRENTFRELLRKLRYEVDHSGSKIFLFTSTQAGAGKTTLLQALAYSFSLSKKKVLLLDTNFCNNDLTKELDAAPRLEEFYVNGMGFQIEKLKEIVSLTQIPNVNIIGCKGGDYTPKEILPKNNLLNYLNEIKKEYDFIFLEGAPLNDFSDSKELLEYVDGVIAVFSAREHINQNDQESIEFLKTLNGKFTGAILNKVELENLEL